MLVLKVMVAVPEKLFASGFARRLKPMAGWRRRQPEALTSRCGAAVDSLPQRAISGKQGASAPERQIGEPDFRIEEI
jgi:hypothetical protein